MAHWLTKCSPGSDTAISALISLALASHMAMPNLRGWWVQPSMDQEGEVAGVCEQPCRWPHGVSKNHKFKTGMLMGSREENSGRQRVQPLTPSQR